MLDWSKCLIECDAAGLPLGRFLAIDSDGVMEWENLRWKSVEGSHQNKIQVRREPLNKQLGLWARAHGRKCPEWVLALSGNPIKFLQGHNVAGLPASAHGELLRRVVDSFNSLGLSKGGLILPDDLPGVFRQRNDVTVNVNLGDNCAPVHDWLLVASALSRGRGKKNLPDTAGGSLTSPKTVYWHRGSKYWQMKAYCKHCELKEHPCNDGNKQKHLLEYTKGKLRLELTLMRRELKTVDELSEQLIFKYWRRLTMGTTDDDYADETIALSRPAYATLCRWRDGQDVKSRLPKPTFYRHRRAILDAHGVDISGAHIKTGDIPPADKGQFEADFLEARIEPDRPAILEQKKLLI